MPVRVSREFRFEAAHRLPWYDGACANLHGHSYHVTVELEAEPDRRGMAVDFKRIKSVVTPLINEWDHAVLIARDDDELIDAMQKIGSRLAVLPADTTAENLARFIAEFVLDQREFLHQHRVMGVGVSVRETVTSEAYLWLPVG